MQLYKNVTATVVRPALRGESAAARAVEPVEAVAAHGQVFVRHAKDRDGLWLRNPAPSWQALVAKQKAGRAPSAGRAASSPAQTFAR